MNEGTSLTIICWEWIKYSTCESERQEVSKNTSIENVLKSIGQNSFSVTAILIALNNATFPLFSWLEQKMQRNPDFNWSGELWYSHMICASFFLLYRFLVFIAILFLATIYISSNDFAWSILWTTICLEFDSSPILTSAQTSISVSWEFFSSQSLTHRDEQNRGVSFKRWHSWTFIFFLLDSFWI